MKRFLTFMMLLGAMCCQQVGAATNIVCYDYAMDFYPELWVDYSTSTTYSGWNIILKGTQGEKVIVAVLDRENAGSLVDGKDYTEESIITDWSGVTMPGTREDLLADEQTLFRVTHDENGGLHILLEASGMSGTKYHVAYDERACEAYNGTTELTFTDEQVTLFDNTRSADKNFAFEANAGNVRIIALIESDVIVGTYTLEDTRDGFTDITFFDEQGNYQVNRLCSFLMEVVEDESHPGTYLADLSMITKSGYGYTTTLRLAPWKRPYTPIHDTATIEAHNLRMMDFREAWGELMFNASCPDYSLNLYVRSETTAGTWTEDDIDFEYNLIWYTGADGREVQATGFDGEYTYTENADGSRSLTGWLDCDDGVHYILQLSYEHPEPTRIETVTLDNGVMEDARGDGSGGIVMMAYDDKRYILLSIYTDEIAGTYTEQSMDWQNTYIVELTDDGEESLLELLDGEVTVTAISDTEYRVEGVMTFQEEMNKESIVEYRLTMLTRLGGEDQAVETVEQGRVDARKILRNGSLYIYQNGEIFDLLGRKL